MNWLLSRLSEPSTGAGVALLAAVAKTVPALAPYSDALNIIMGFAATHAVVMPEKAA